MKEVKKINIDGQEYTVSLDRFDEDIDIENGASYHGFYITVTAEGFDVIARKYDYENSVSVQQGIMLEDKEKIEIMRAIARELFATETLELLTSGGSLPYQKV